MLAVSNTSPISNLASIGRLDLLKFQFSALWIPAAVADELVVHPDPAARAVIQTAIHEQWIRTALPQTSTLLSILLSSLHKGEAEAIALAIDLKADLVIIDEQEGRQTAKQAGLSVIGVLGILLRAKRMGAIPAVRPEIQALRDKARFFIAPLLEAKVLASAGE
jgi:predicted nucleic acid-binding protein